MRLRVDPNVAWPAGIAAAGLAWYLSESLRHRRESGHGYDLVGEVDVGSPEFLHAAEALTGAPISVGNDLELLINGDRIFPAFLETIRGARRSVNLLTYVYWRGEIAHRMADCLAAKARDGVPVKVLLDAVGSLTMGADVIERMRDAGVTVCRFRPPKPYAIGRLTNRTHRKLLVADGRVGMIGGVGIAEEWEGDAQDPDHWRDTHVRVRGPVVRGLHRQATRAGGRPALLRRAARGGLPDLRVPGHDAARQDARRGPGVVVRRSVNFDNRSFQLHDEAMLCVQSERFASELTESFEHDLTRSEEIEPGRWNGRPAWRRAQERAVALLRREL